MGLVVGTYDNVIAGKAMVVRADDQTAHPPCADGLWYEGLDNGLRVANQNYIPLIAYWTPGTGCCMCSKMENECFKNEDFKEFKKTSPYIWCYGETPYADTIYKFCRGIKSNWRQDVKLNGYPYCCFYWKVNDFLTIYVNSSGRLDCLPIDGNTNRGGLKLWKSMVASIKHLFKAYVPQS